jgi:DNA replication protein DnaC
VHKVGWDGKTDWARIERCRCVAAADMKDTAGLAMRGVVDFNAGLSNLEPRGNLEQIVAAAKLLVETQAPPMLLITGGVGNGKTHISQAITRLLNLRGFKTNYYPVKGLLDTLKSKISDHSLGDYKSALNRIPGLVLDDFGMNRGTDWELSELESVIDHRYQHRMVTVMTSNLELKQINQISPRIYSRFMDSQNSKCFVNNAPDYRVSG